MENLADLVTGFAVQAAIAVVILIVGRWIARQVANFAQRMMVHPRIRS